MPVLSCLKDVIIPLGIATIILIAENAPAWNSHTVTTSN